MSAKIEMIGKRFGRLIVISEGEKGKSREYKWICKCDCGTITKPIRSSHLRGGKIKSCGCLQREIVTQWGKAHPPKYIATHRESRSRIYKIWQGIKSRCNNPNSTNYKNYGGRGIKICDEWKNNFVCFRDWAMANGYKSEAKRGECTIDRIDVNGNYCPENCRFITIAEQSKNKRKRSE